MRVMCLFIVVLIIQDILNTLPPELQNVTSLFLISGILFCYKQSEDQPITVAARSKE
jgi:hypothetical protein